MSDFRTSHSVWGSESKTSGVQPKSSFKAFPAEDKCSSPGNMEPPGDTGQEGRRSFKEVAIFLKWEIHLSPGFSPGPWELLPWGSN